MGVKATMIMESDKSTYKVFMVEGEMTNNKTGEIKKVFVHISSKLIETEEQAVKTFKVCNEYGLLERSDDLIGLYKKYVDEKVIKLVKAMS